MSIKEKIDLLIKANIAYRRGRDEILTDKEYDALITEVKDTPEYKEIKHLLNEGAVDGSDFKHSYVIGSLEKLKNGEDDTIEAFDNDNKSNTKNWVITPKLDGAALTLYYVDGKLSEIATRGDGYKGKSQLKRLYDLNIPKTLKFLNEGKVVIRGEILLTHQSFEELNEDTNGKYKKHPRSAIVGLLGDKNDTYHVANYASFYAYRVLSEYNTESYKNELKLLKKEGFNIPFSTSLKQGELNSENLMEIYKDTLNKVPWEIDGLVIQSNENYEYENEYYPSNARAFKANELAAESTVVGIDWRITKDGSLSPIAQVNPVMLAGAEITQASAFNYEWIVNHGIGIGAKVVIIKSGEIIPVITQVITTSKKIDVPEVCPNCGGSLEVRGKKLFCTNPDCSESAYKSLAFFIENLGIPNVSEKTLRAWELKSINDIINFEADSKYKKQVEFAKALPEKFWSITYTKLMCSFDYKGIGEKIIKKLIKANGINKMNKALFIDDSIELETPTGTTQDTLIRLRKAINSNNLKSIWNNIVNDDRWLAYNDIRERELNKEANQNSLPLSGMSFCFTGAMSIGRNFAQEMVENLGGENKSSVSRGLTYLVTNNKNSGSGKNKKASELGTTIIDENEFFKMINYDPDKGRQIEENDLDNF